MCGISGIIKFDSKEVDDVQLNLLTESLAHRGPDGQGIWINDIKNIGFGHRRLSILDLSDVAKQPMSYLNERYWITLNGEIYNFLEIKDELIVKGFSFSTESDTEVILAAYHEWGEDCLHKFNGMWAFAIYDSVNKSVFFSRDRFGVKPVYYYSNENQFVFASEIQAIHKILGYNHPLNEAVIIDTIKAGSQSHGTNQTYLKNVFSIPPGYKLVIRNNAIKISEWYTLQVVKVPKTLRKQSVAFRELFKDACKLRLRSDVPVATCLSGGLDSSSITGIIRHLDTSNESRFNQFTHTGFNLSLPKTPIDEYEKAKLLAEKTGTDLKTCVLEKPDVLELELAMKQCDGPMSALAFYPIWKLYQFIRAEGIVVTLDGQGPDEMIGGYDPLISALNAAWDLKKPFWLWDVYKTYSSQGESSQFSAKKESKRRLSNFLKRKRVSIWNKATKPMLVLLCKLRLYTFPDYPVQDKKLAQAPLDPIRKSNFKMNQLDQELYRQTFQTQLITLFNQYDRCSMAHGIECRMPFMDYRLVEFIFSLPPQSKVGGGYTKRILRRAMKGIIPDEIRLNKIKIGFNAPNVDWFTGALKDWMLNIMYSSEFVNCKFFNGEELKSKFEKFISAQNPSWYDAWTFWGPVHFVWWAKENRIPQNYFLK